MKNQHVTGHYQGLYLKNKDQTVKNKDFTSVVKESFVRRRTRGSFSVAKQGVSERCLVVTSPVGLR